MDQRRGPHGGFACWKVQRCRASGDRSSVKGRICRVTSWKVHFRVGCLFSLFLAKQSLVPAAREEGRAEPGLQLTAEPCLLQLHFEKAFWGGVGIAFIPVS